MATLVDLNYTSITEMLPDEAMALISQIRFARRTPSAKPRKTSSRTKTKAVPKVSSDQAAEILKLLGGKQ
jgi:hypothetical protein